MTARIEYMTFAEYREYEAVNKSWLKEMDVSPLHFRTYPERGRRDTPALRIGRPIHTAVLEPELFDAVTAVWEGGLTKKGEPTMSKNSSDYKEWAAKMEKDGRQPLEEAEQWLCRRIRRAVQEHSFANTLISEADTEQTILWDHPIGVHCKSRLDFLAGSYMGDLKTALDITPEGFARAAAKYGYHRQAAMYVDAVKALTGRWRPYYIVAVEKAEPFDVAVYEIGGDVLEIGRSQYTDNLRKVKDCRRTGIWPGVCSGVQSLEMPHWFYTDEAEVLDWSGVTE